MVERVLDLEAEDLGLDHSHATSPAFVTLGKSFHLSVFVSLGIATFD